ncbi:MAG: hypothetical protein ACFFDN_42745, partial [Candidatus Hodarchaeota archaeon]
GVIIIPWPTSTESEDILTISSENPNIEKRTYMLIGGGNRHKWTINLENKIINSSTNNIEMAKINFSHRFPPFPDFITIVDEKEHYHSIGSHPFIDNSWSQYINYLDQTIENQIDIFSVLNGDNQLDNWFTVEALGNIEISEFNPKNYLATLIFDGNDKEQAIPGIDPPLLDGEKCFPVSFSFDNADVEDNKAEYKPYFIGIDSDSKDQRPAVYVHHVPYVKDGNKTYNVIEYWLYYADNPYLDKLIELDFFGKKIIIDDNHEHDWECYFVYLENGQPEYVVTGLHGLWVKHDWNRLLTEVDDKNHIHPKIAVDCGSHAMWRYSEDGVIIHYDGTVEVQNNAKLDPLQNYDQEWIIYSNDQTLIGVQEYNESPDYFYYGDDEYDGEGKEMTERRDAPWLRYVWNDPPLPSNIWFCGWKFALGVIPPEGLEIVKYISKFGSTRLMLPGEAIQSETFASILETFSKETENIINSANKDAEQNLNLFPFFNLNTIREIAAVSINDNRPISDLNEFATFNIPYPDADNNGIIDGCKINESTLRMFCLNEQNEKWEKVNWSWVNPIQNSVSAKLKHLSTFCLMGVNGEGTIFAGNGGHISLLDGTKIEIPPNILPSDINITIAEIDSNSQEITAANNKLSTGYSIEPIRKVNTNRIFYALNLDNGNKIKELNGFALITLSFPDTDQNSIVDGTELNENKLGLFYLNEENLSWKLVKNSRVFPENNIVLGEFNRLGIFGIFSFTQ